MTGHVTHNGQSRSQLDIGNSPGELTTRRYFPDKWIKSDSCHMTRWTSKKQTFIASTSFQSWRERM